MQVPETVEKLRKETKALRKEVIIIKLLLKQQREIISTILEQNYSKNKNRVVFTRKKYFPLINQQDLDKFEFELFNDSTRDEIIREARLSVRPYGLMRALKSIISHELAFEYNLDGTYGKKRLFNYKNLLDTLYRAIEEDGYSHEQFIRHLRAALHCLKKRNARSKWASKKLKTEKMEEVNEGSDEELDNEPDEEPDDGEEFANI